MTSINRILKSSSLVLSGCLAAFICCGRPTSQPVNSLIASKRTQTKLAIVPSTQSLSYGQTQQFRVVSFSDKTNGPTLLPSSVSWSCSGGSFSKNIIGLYIAPRMGNGTTITATVDGATAVKAMIKLSNAWVNSNVKAIADSPVGITLSWPESEGAARYRVYRSTSTTFDNYYNAIAEPVPPRFGDDMLTPGTTYYYLVYALDADGSTPQVGQVTMTTPAK